MLKYTSNDWPLSVIEEGNNTFTIEWDENNPITSKLNTWTQEDFLRAIVQGLEDELFILIEEECAKR